MAKSRKRRKTLIFSAIGIVFLLLVLMAVFRSVLVPLKAVVMNLLSVGAAIGILAWAFVA